MNKVKAPDGNIYEIPDDQVESALAAGGSLVDAPETTALADDAAQVGRGLRAATLGAGQGLTAGFLDEISGAVASPTGALKTVLGSEEDEATKRYKEYRDLIRAYNKQDAEEFPVLSTGSEIAGGLVGGAKVAKGLSAVGKGAMAALPARAKALLGASSEGAALGGLFGAGASEGETMSQVASDALDSASMGGALGVGSKLLGPKAGALVGAGAGAVAGSSLSDEDMLSPEALLAAGAGAIAGGKLGKTIGTQNKAEGVDYLSKVANVGPLKLMAEGFDETTPLWSNELRKKFAEVDRKSSGKEMTGLLNSAEKESGDIFKKLYADSDASGIKLNLSSFVDDKIAQVKNIETATQNEVDAKNKLLKKLESYRRKTSDPTSSITADVSELDVKSFKAIEKELSEMANEDLSRLSPGIQRYTNKIKNEFEDAGLAQLPEDMKAQYERGNNLFKSSRIIKENLLKKTSDRPTDFLDEKAEQEASLKVLKDISSDKMTEGSEKTLRAYSEFQDLIKKNATVDDSLKGLNTPEGLSLTKNLLKKFEDKKQTEKVAQRAAGYEGLGAVGSVKAVASALGLEPTRIGNFAGDMTRRAAKTSDALTAKVSQSALTKALNETPILGRVSRGTADMLKKLSTEPDKQKQAALMFALQQDEGGREALKEIEGRDE